MASTPARRMPECADQCDITSRRQLFLPRLHGMQTRSSDEKVVCPSVCLSVCQTRAL